MSIKLMNSSALEYGSSQYGDYLKMANGILICWRRATITPTYSGTFGDFKLFKGSGLSFALAFVSKPVVHITNTGGSTFLIGQVNTGNDYIISIELFKNDTSASSCTLDIMAIGRWK